MLARLRNESGVALVTVLFIGAALTVVTTTATFVAIQQAHSSLDDRKAETALGYAEAGIDSMIDYISSSGNVTANMLFNAGCPVNGVINYLTTAGLVQNPANAPVTSLGNGTYQAYATVYNINSSDPATQFPPGACSALSGQGTSPHDTHYVVITSTGRSPAAKRVVQQVIKITPRGMPIGLYAQGINAGGTPNIVGDSMVTTDKIVGRDKLIFTGCDPYYKLSDFWPTVSFPSTTRCYPYVPSSAHAVGGIFMKQNGTEPEFTGGSGTINCTANGTSGSYAYQSLWDGDGSPGSGAFSGTCNGLPGSPGTSRFTSADAARVAPQPTLTADDYDALKRAAQASGIYCSGPTASTCTVAGTSATAPTTWQDGDIAPVLNSGTLNFVAYFDFSGGSASDNLVKWKASVQPVGTTDGTACSSDPTKNRSVIIVVHNGSIELENGAVIEGAIILDGSGAQFKYNGNPVIDGPIIAPNGTINMGGGPTFQLDSCYVTNMQSLLLLKATPVHWSEIDR